MNINGTKFSQSNTGCKTQLMSLKQKLLLNSKIKSDKQLCSSKRKAGQNSLKGKGHDSTITNVKQNKNKEGIPKSSTSETSSASVDHHHNYASCQQFGIEDDLMLFSSDESSVEIDIPFVDTTAIKSLIVGLPQISFLDEGTAPTIACVRVCDRQKVSKTFETVIELQEYLRSANAKLWLTNEKEMRIGKSNRTPSRRKASKNVILDTVTESIIRISFIEKSNAYKLDYFCPCHGQRLTKIFGKFSMLLTFLQSSDVSACLINISKNCKTRFSSFPDVRYSNNAETASKSSTPAYPIVKNIKLEVEDLDSKPLVSFPGKEYDKHLSIFQTYSEDLNGHEALINNTECSIHSETHASASSHQEFDMRDTKPSLNCLTNGEEYVSSNLNSKEVIVKELPSKGAKYNIDTSAIKPLIAGYPKITYNKKFDNYKIACIRACDGQRVVTSFRNLECMQTFVSSEDAKAWLMDELEPSGRTYKGNSRHVSYNSELLVIKPEIVFLKPDRLRVLCIPRFGRPKTKFFRCSNQGQNDVVAMQKIHEFLNSQSFISWITSDRRCNNTGKGVETPWTLRDTVRTGADMRVYLEELLDFDCTKHVEVNSCVAPYLNIHHNPEVLSVSRTSNPSWGRSHRSDDTFSLKDDAPSDLFRRMSRVISVSVRCSSRSNMCRAACGELLTNCKIVGNCFSCCSELVPVHNECSHCKATTSSYNKWHKHDDGVLCRVCYNYLKKRKTPRPLKAKKILPKPFYIHNQCQYKLRLELLPDLEYWEVYYHNANKDDHDCASAVGCKRFTLTERDYIDKVRASTGRMTAKQIGISYRSFRQESSSHPLRQYQSRCKVVDNHILDGNVEELEESITISPDWSGECLDTDNEVECIKFEIYDTVPEFEFDTTVPAVVESKPNYEWNVEPNAEPNALDTPQKKSVKREDAPIVCFKCVMDPNRKGEPFSCNDSKDLDSHIRMCHRENVICCSICFQLGAIESFPSLRLLNHHIRQFHNKEKGSKGAHSTSYTFSIKSSTGDP